MKDIKNKTLFFNVLNHCSFSPSFMLINYLYRPIIGPVSSEIYKFLAKYNHINRIIKKNENIFELCSYLAISKEEFDQERKKLEAISLLETFYDEYENVLYFKLLNPLEFKEFISNKCYYNLLSQKYELSKIEEISFYFSDRNNPAKDKNISSNFNDIFNNDKFDNFNFNFSLLYDNVHKYTKKIWILDVDSKNIIENYFKNFRLSFDAIQNICLDALQENEFLEFYLEKNLLISLLDNEVFKLNNKENHDFVFLNRDSDIFNKEIDNFMISAVFLDYMNNKSERYLSSLKRNILSKNELDLIIRTREQLKIGNDVINMVIDYSIYKTHGKINLKYIEKTLQTISNLGCKTLSKAYQYLVSLSNNKSKNISSNNDCFNEISSFNFNFD
ncbi:MAG: DnaD domain protein [Mycoplasmoidaceae bacterium]